jgi:hypothetical protein
MFTPDGKPSDDDPREHRPRVGDERSTLVEALRYQRLTLELKCEGLDAEQMARRSIEPSTLSLLGLVRHLAEMERATFRQLMSGQDVPRLFCTPTDRDGDFDGAVLGPDALCIRFFGDNNDCAEDRLLVMNLGKDLELNPAPEPLLAPPLGMRWAVELSTEDPKYDGNGTAAPDTELEGWRIPGRCAIFLKPAGTAEATVPTRVRVAGSAQEAKLREKRLEEQEKSEKAREQG